MFQILLWSPWKYRCGQRTVRMAVMACSQNQAVFARRRSELKLKLELVEEKQKLLDIRAELEREKENARDSPLVSMEIPLRTAYSQAGRCGMQPKAKHSLRAQAHQSKSRTETVKTETLEKKLRIRKKKRRTREVREQALPSEYHRQTYL
ncbi:hypothetical protein TNCV_4877311 [Trichonephila clavipes]|nr:hypothetical protein TNCV_4877311 [Trichonephila clavipes]